MAAAVLVVAAAGLGTLNHTAVTVKALRTRGLGCAGLVIGLGPLSRILPPGATPLNCLPGLVSR